MTWNDAIEICFDIGVGFSDAMILNALQCTTLPFAVCLDSDLAYSVVANPALKDVIMPDEIVCVGGIYPNSCLIVSSHPKCMCVAFCLYSPSENKNSSCVSMASKYCFKG